MMDKLFRSLRKKQQMIQMEDDNSQFALWPD